MAARATIDMVYTHPGLTATELGKLLARKGRAIGYGTISSELHRLCKAKLLRRKIGVSVASLAAGRTLKDIKFDPKHRVPGDWKYTAWRYYPPEPPR